MRTNKSTHVLYDAQDLYSCFLTEGDLSSHISCRHCLQSIHRRKKRCYNLICLFLLRVVVVQSCGYLRRGYQDCSIDTAVFFHVFQHCQMFIRRPWWCVHQQHIQFPPRNIWHKLANQSCWMSKKRKLRENTICNSTWYDLGVLYYKTIPFFLGPLHTTASSGSSSRKPIDISASVFWTSV